jgi:zinc protease
MQTPKTSISYMYSGDIQYTLENRITMDALSQILRIRYTEVIREEKGATYGVRVTGSFEREPQERYSLVVSFDSDKEKVEKLGLLDDISSEIKKIAENAPATDDLSKIKEFLVKQRKDDLKQNNTWLNYLVSWHVTGFDSTSDYDKYVEELSAEKIQKLAAKILADNNLIRVIMNDKTGEN